MGETSSRTGAATGRPPARAPLRSGVQSLVDGWRLDRGAPDPERATAHLALAEEHLAAARADEQAGRTHAARSVAMEAIGHGLHAMLAHHGLVIVARGQQGREEILVDFGAGELGRTRAEQRAARQLVAARREHVDQRTSGRAPEALGGLLAIAETVIGAARRRIGG